MQNLTNKILDNRYRFDHLIGEGTFSRVYRVHDTKRGVDLAAKVLRQDIAHEPTFVERFKREARLLQQLQHPHIVRYYETVEVDNIVFITLDYIAGDTLQTFLYKYRTPLTTTQVLEFIQPLTAALRYAHQDNIIHRDIKPANVLLGLDNRVYITDFGIARLLSEASTLTNDTAIGTPLYMAPEQIMGKEATASVDIYAVGVLLYQMFAGKLPFTGDSPNAMGNTTSERVAYEHLHVSPPPPQTDNPELSDQAQLVILRCLEKKPEDRYESVLDIYKALTGDDNQTPAEIPEKEPAPPLAPLPEWSQILKNPNYEPTPQQNIDPVHQTVINDSPTTIESPAIPAVHTPKNPTPQRPTMVGKQSISQYAPPTPVAQYTPPYVSQQSYSPPLPNSTQTNTSSSTGIMVGAVVAIIALLLAILCSAAIVLSSGILEDEGGTEPTPINVVLNENNQLPSDNTDTIDITENPNVSVTTNPTPIPSINNQTETPQTIGGDSTSDSLSFIYSASTTEGGDTDIFSQSLSGGTPIRLTSSSLYEMGGTYSPDGNKIAYYAYSDDNLADIWLMDSDGSNPRRLTNTYGNDRVVTWSPDSQRIAFHSNDDGDYDIYVIDIETLTIINISNNNYDDLGPNWSPDGTSIAFHTTEIRGFYEVFVMNPDGTNRQQVTDGSWRAAFPDWVPNRNRLAFHAITRTYQIYSINPDGSDFEQLFAANNNQRYPVWAFDGVQMLYMQGDINNPAIGYTNFQTGEIRTVVDNGWYPDWKP